MFLFKHKSREERWCTTSRVVASLVAHVVAPPPRASPTYVAAASCFPLRLLPNLNSYMGRPKRRGRHMRKRKRIEYKARNKGDWRIETANRCLSLSR